MTAFDLGLPGVENRIEHSYGEVALEFTAKDRVDGDVDALFSRVRHAPIMDDRGAPCKMRLTLRRRRNLATRIASNSDKAIHSRCQFFVAKRLARPSGG